jgi:hypothetical protein
MKTPEFPQRTLSDRRVRRHPGGKGRAVCNVDAIYRIIIYRNGIQHIVRTSFSIASVIHSGPAAFHPKYSSATCGKGRLAYRPRVNRPGFAGQRLILMSESFVSRSWQLSVLSSSRQAGLTDMRR